MVRVLLTVATGAFLVVAVIVSARSIAAAGDLGIDFRFYRDVGARFLEDGTYYLPHQLAGPYSVTLMEDVLYPPLALALFVPFVYLPAILWWAVPVGVTLWAVGRPSAVGLTLALLLLCWPRAHAAFLFGNTDMWVMAGVAAGMRLGWPAVLVTLKPTLVPFALVGIRHRSWWMAMALLAASVVLTWPLWQDYIVAMTNLRADPGYSLGSIPLLLVPVVATIRWPT